MDDYRMLYQRLKIAIQLSAKASTYRRVGEHLSSQSRRLDAINRCWRAFAKRRTRSLYTFHSAASKVFEKLGQLERAEGHLRQAIAFDNRGYGSYMKLGKMLSRQKKWTSAVEVYEDAISAHPDAFWLYYHLGKALIAAEQWKRATTVLKRANQMNPAHYDTCSELEKLLAMTLEVNASDSNMLEVTAQYRSLSRGLVAASHPHFSPLQASSEGITYPSFLIIGQTKCGTTSLYSYLIQHPQILPSITKEIHFWNNNFHLGLDWYSAHFPQLAPETYGETPPFITGEASASYFGCTEIAPRIYSHMPSVKLIILLRNPVDRAISHYHMSWRLGTQTKSIEETIFSVVSKSTLESAGHCSAQSTGTASERKHSSRYLRGSQYIDLIKPWLEVFTREQVLIVKSEDLFLNPLETVNNAFRFLDVPTCELPHYKIVNKGRYSSISKAQRSLLSDYFRPYNEILEDYLDRPFYWD